MFKNIEMVFSFYKGYLINLRFSLQDTEVGYAHMVDGQELAPRNIGGLCKRLSIDSFKLSYQNRNLQSPNQP